MSESSRGLLAVVWESDLARGGGPVYGRWRGWVIWCGRLLQSLHMLRPRFLCRILPISASLWTLVVQREAAIGRILHKNLRCNTIFLSFVRCCMPSLSSIPRYLCVPLCLSSCIYLLSQVLNFVSELIFLSWVQSLHTCQVNIPYVSCHSRFWILASFFFVEFYILFYLSASNHLYKVSVILLYLLCVLPILYSAVVL